MSLAFRRRAVAAQAWAADTAARDSEFVFRKPPVGGGSSGAPQSFALEGVKTPSTTLGPFAADSEAGSFMEKD
ncbi:hypothetical protein AURDEDRAFT_164447 [Auricularia subglabra TFB-10046 SS5]|nr:hypothetical protein AURDEDRAFT_164447 [Auricularia subglabra TFB-10046 SS5]